MKKQRLVLWVGLLTLFSTYAIAADSVLVYENKPAGVKLRYPADWIKSETLPGALIAFGAPKEKANLKMVENVTLSVQVPSKEFATLEKYTRMYDEQRKKDPIAPKVLESKKTTLGGLPAQRIVCVGQQNGMEIQFLQVWTMRKGKAYLFTYGSSKETYKNFEKEAEKIIASLAFV